MTRVVVSDAKTVDVAAGRERLSDVADRIDTAVARTPEEVGDVAAGADALVVDAATPVTAAVFDELDELDVVGRAGIGVDNVDLEAAADAGVTVVNVPDYCVAEVSTHALALLLACVRRLSTYDRQTRAGDWDWEAGVPTHRLAGRTLGLWGFGDVGRALARKVAGFDIDVVAHDPYVGRGTHRAAGVEPVSFDDLCERADLLSIHVPLTDETRAALDADALSRLPEGAVVVNTARGGVVDEVALADALDSGPVAAAGLDVLSEEPPADSPLVGQDDVLVTPHAAWYSEESREELSRAVCEDVARVLRGAEPRSPVTPGDRW